MYHKVCKVYKVHKVCKVTGILRMSFIGSPSCREQSTPRGSIDLIDFMNLTDLTDSIIFRIFVNTNTIKTL